MSWNAVVGIAAAVLLAVGVTVGVYVNRDQPIEFAASLTGTELAPNEDQGVVFGVIQAAPNSTIDQTRLFTNQVYDVYHAFPENQSIFQITSPTGGFGGMVTKPWSERKKTAQQLLLESTGPLSKIAGIRVIPTTPPALPGGGTFPVDFVIA